MSSSTRHLSGEGLQLSPSGEKCLSDDYIDNNAPQVVTPDMEGYNNTGEPRTNYGQESAYQEKEAVGNKRTCGLRRRTFWIVFGSFGLAVLIALIAVIGVLSQKVSQNKR